MLLLVSVFGEVWKGVQAARIVRQVKEEEQVQAGSTGFEYGSEPSFFIYHLTVVSRHLDGSSTNPSAMVG